MNEVPKITSVKMVMQFADGRWCAFEANEPADAEIKVERVPVELSFMRDFQSAVPEVISYLAGGEISGVLLRIKAQCGHDYRLRYGEGASSD